MSSKRGLFLALSRVRLVSNFSNDAPPRHGDRFLTPTIPSPSRPHKLVSVIREEIVEEQRGRHGASQVSPATLPASAAATGGREGATEGGAGGGEAAIETVLMKVFIVV